MVKKRITRKRMVKKVKKTQRGGGNNSPNNNKRKLLELEAALRKYGYAVYSAENTNREYNAVKMFEHTYKEFMNAALAANRAKKDVLDALDVAIVAANAVSKDDVEKIAAKFVGEADNQGKLSGAAMLSAEIASLDDVVKLAKHLATEHA